MPAGLGARLRQRREEQGIALRTIADDTKIKLSLLEGLERDDLTHWPAGIFTRAYLRAYAQAIHMDADAVVREFMEVHPEPLEDAAAPLPAAADEGTRRGAAPATRIRQIVGSAFGSLLGRGSHESPGPLPSTEPGPAKPASMSETAPANAPGPAIANASAPASPAAEADLDFLAVARLCTDLGRVESAGDVAPLLARAARLLDASGVIVWVWDALADGLRPALAHGYSQRVLSTLPPVKRDEDHATAAAFRSARTAVSKGSERSHGALALPLLTPAGCAGVLAIELLHGSEQRKSVRAAATMFAALLAQLVGGAQPAPGEKQLSLT